MKVKNIICVLCLLMLVHFVQAQVKSKPSFLESKISVKVDTNKLYGTLTKPVAKGKCPVMLFIAGSGHTDRDGNQPNMTSNAYKQVAEKLAQKGIAMVRYDKRGVGESVFTMVEENLRFDQFVDDATLWIKQLKSDARFSKVIVAGHSEGSLIGMLACQKANADAFISLEGASASIDQILKTQLVTAVPDSFYYGLCCRYLDTLKEGKLLTNSEPGLASLFRASIQPYMINWIQYNPSEEIVKLHIPILIVQGETDIQVDINNAFELADACPKAHVKIIKGMNHALKTAELEREKNFATYSDPNLPVVQNLLDEIQTFISIMVMR